MLFRKLQVATVIYDKFNNVIIYIDGVSIRQIGDIICKTISYAVDTQLSIRCGILM